MNKKIKRINPKFLLVLKSGSIEKKLLTIKYKYKTIKNLKVFVFIQSNLLKLKI